MRVCICLCLYVYACVYVYIGVPLVYIMLLDGKVSHVAANITIVSVRVHTSDNSSGTSSDISTTVHIRVAFSYFAVLKNSNLTIIEYTFLLI